MVGGVLCKSNGHFLHLCSEETLLGEAEEREKKKQKKKLSVFLSFALRDEG